jgi:hypothetical protein
MKTKRKTNINRVTEELNGYLTEIAAAKHWLMELDEEWKAILSRSQRASETRLEAVLLETVR